MPPSAHPTPLSDADAGHDQAPGLRVELARTTEDVVAAQRLRYRIFVEELGARIDCRRPGIESNALDPYTRHLLIRELRNGAVVGCCRILTDTRAIQAGRYSSQREFDLTRILALPERFMEVSRACVHPEYRNGTAVTLLWTGLARYMLKNGIDCLIGSVGIPLKSGTLYPDFKEAAAIYHELSKRYLAPAQFRVYPRVPICSVKPPEPKVKLSVPPLIEASLRMGTKICGKPAWNFHFNVADLFMLLRADDLPGSPRPHFP